MPKNILKLPCPGPIEALLSPQFLGLYLISTGLVVLDA